MAKVRLDTVLVDRELVESRSKAQALIMAGKVRVEGRVVIKAGTPISSEAVIEIEEPLPYVGRGGLKVAAALEAFQIDPAGLICADVGASTGGFTDVLLQHNAARVYAIDVGYGQLAWKVRQDERVVVLERTNARYVEHLPEAIDLVTIDVSFISLKLILPAVKKWLVPSARVVALVKPQFEAGRDQIGKGGIVRSRAVQQQVLEMIADFAQTIGFELFGLIPSPITGAAGNQEFLMYLGWNLVITPVELANALEICWAKLDESVSSL